MGGWGKRDMGRKKGGWKFCLNEDRIACKKMFTCGAQFLYIFLFYFSILLTVKAIGGGGGGEGEFLIFMFFLI
jgi:hypothetical protein